MNWLWAILKAIPLLSKIAKFLESKVKKSNAKARRKKKDTLVDDAIANALADERLRDNKVRERTRSNQETPKRF
tara:strand:+ start:7763 stop:7984 length:222 start_codon:yes stop_codon:yes gene_type:complete